MHTTTKKHIDETPIFNGLPIVDIKKIGDKNVYTFNKDGSIGLTYKFTGINDSGFKEEEYLKYYEILEKLIKRLISESITTQFQVIRTANLEVFENKAFNIPRVLTERVAFLEKLIQNGQILKNHYYIHLNNKPTKQAKTFKERLQAMKAEITHAFSEDVDKEMLELKFQTVKRQKRELDSFENSIVSALKESGIKCKRLNTKKEYFDLYRKITAPNKSKNEKPMDQERTFRQNVFDGVNCKEMPNYFILDDYYHQVFELESLSSATIIEENAIGRLVNAPFEHIYTVNFQTYNKRKSMQVIDKLIKHEVTSAKFESKNGELSTDGQNKVERYISAKENLSTDNEQVIELSCNLIYRENLRFLERRLHRNSQTLDEFVFENKERLYNSIFSYLADSEWLSYEEGQWDGFRSVFPCTTNLLSKNFKTIFELGSKLPYLLPLFGGNREDLDHYGFNHFLTESFGIEPFDIFDPKLDSWCTLVSGDMGSGKSFVLNLMLTMSLSSLLTTQTMPLVRIIDIGGIKSSFKKIFDILGGEVVNVSRANLPKINIFDLNPKRSYPKKSKMDQIIHFLKENYIENESDQEVKGKIFTFYDMRLDHEGQLGIEDNQEYFKKLFQKNIKAKDLDIFDLNEGECAPTMDRMRIIMGYLEIMLSSNPERVNTFSYDIINYDHVHPFVETLYEVSDKTPLMSDLVKLIEDAIEGQDHGVFHEVLKRLSNWTINGQYKSFDYKTEINLENDLIMFDLFGVEKDPRLNAIYTALVMDLFSNDMFEKMDRKRLCMFDEAHKVMGNELMREGLIQFARLSRKYKFPVFLASQLPTDWFEKDQAAGNVLVSQSTRFIFCGTKKRFICEQAQGLYELTNAQTRTLQELGVKTTGGMDLAPVYSRFMIISDQKDGRKVQVLRNVLSPFELTIHSSSADDNIIYNFYRYKKKLEPYEVCDLLSREDHIGDEELIEFLKKNSQEDALKIVNKEGKSINLTKNPVSRYFLQEKGMNPHKILELLISGELAKDKDLIKYLREYGEKKWIDKIVSSHENS